MKQNLFQAIRQQHPHHGQALHVEIARGATLKEHAARGREALSDIVEKQQQRHSRQGWDDEADVVAIGIGRGPAAQRFRRLPQVRCATGKLAGERALHRVGKARDQGCGIPEIPEGNPVSVRWRCGRAHQQVLAKDHAYRRRRGLAAGAGNGLTPNKVVRPQQRDHGAVFPGGDPEPAFDPPEIDARDLGEVSLAGLFEYPIFLFHLKR